MKLSKRLQAIYNMVPSSVVADVGSDHGKLIISLFEDGVISKGYAIENKKGPYSRLVEAIEKHGVKDHVIPMLSDGITELPKDVETVVIAGMGGMNVIDIIKKKPGKLKNVKTIIVDAHNAIPEMRKFISKLGYIIADEDIVEEKGIFYEIIKFIAGEACYLDEPDVEFGPILRSEKSATFREKYQNRIFEIDAILAKGTLPKSRIHSLNEEKQKLERYL